MEQRDKFKGVESIKFYSRFTDDASCLEYLSSIKWADGFKCKKCGAVLSVPRGKGTLRVVCPKCKTETTKKS